MAQSGRSSFFSKLDAPWEMRIASVIRICSYIGMGSIVVMMVLTFSHSVGRYALDSPIPGMVELSRFLLVLAIFMISAYCAVEKGHISVGILVDRMSTKKQGIIDSIMYTIAFVIGSIAVWRTVVKGLHVIEQNPVTTVLRIPEGPFVMIVAFGWTILTIAVFMHLRHMYLRAAGVEK
ncbi:TRAP transporter small permease [Chloroflexota bacterium]